MKVNQLKGMKWVVSLCLAFFSLPTVCAQTIDWGKANGIKADTIHKEILEPTRFMASYNTVLIQNPERPKKKTISTTLLQVGDRYNRFTDLHRLPYDAIMDSMGRGEITPMDGFLPGLNILKKVKFKEFILQDRQTETETVQYDAYPGLYEYKEPIPKMEWVMAEGDTTLLGLKCSKALLNFRGRDYTAWYCPEIPLPFGPYNFGGLPGLIFKITDSKNHVDFTIQGFESAKDYLPLYIYTNERLIKTSRDQVRKAIKASFMNPVEYDLSHGRKVSEDQLNSPSYQSKPYYPIELK